MAASKHTFASPESATGSGASQLAFAEAFRWLSTALVVIFAGFLVYRIVRPEERAGFLVSAADAVTFLAAAAARLWSHHRVLSLRSAQPAAAALGLLVLLNTEFSILVSASTDDLVYLPLILVGAGAILISPFWFWLLAAASIVTVVPVTLWQAADLHEAMTILVSLAASVVFGATIHQGRYRSYRQLEALQELEAEHAQELRGALRQAEQALLDRTQAEARRRELEDQLRRTQRIEALGVLAGGVAHDMNNVLGAITAVASTARDVLSRESALRSDFDQILAAARQGNALTRNLLGFARRGRQQNRRLSFRRTVVEVLALLERTLPKRVALVSEIAAGLDDVMGDAGQLGHLVMNLCLNAADAIDATGTIRVLASNTEIERDDAPLQRGRYVVLRVIDDGVGMSPETQMRVFEPFFTTKGSGDRSGLGLSMVYGTVQEYGGDVSIKSALGRGTTVSIRLPSAPAGAAGLPSDPPIPAPAKEIRTALLVDDEPLLRTAGQRLLRSLGIDARLATNGRDAIEQFAEHHEAVDVVVLDLSMPEMGGAECFDHLRDIDPDVPVLLASGYTTSDEVDRLLSCENVGFMAKPYDRRTFARALRELTVAMKDPADAA